MIKGSIQQKEITILNIYTPDIRAPKFIKQASISRPREGEIDRQRHRERLTPIEQ